MGSSGSFAKTIVIPAIISLTLYLLFSFLIIPFFRHYHQRYSQYLPLHAISAHTSTLRDRIADFIMRLFLPRTWRQDAARLAAVDANDNISILEEEGEIMAGMHMDPARRAALERRHGMGGGGGDVESRLSRDLEEGFMDDSDDEEDGRR